MLKRPSGPGDHAVRPAMIMSHSADGLVASPAMRQLMPMTAMGSGGAAPSRAPPAAAHSLMTDHGDPEARLLVESLSLRR
jgi:hypothetical protein